MGGTNFIPPVINLTKAVIGVGGMGQGHLEYEGTRLCKFCDADANHLLQTLQKVGSSVKGYFVSLGKFLQRPDCYIVHISDPLRTAHGPYVYNGCGKQVRMLVRRKPIPEPLS